MITQGIPKTDGQIRLIFTASHLSSLEIIMICSTTAGPVWPPVVKPSSSRIRLHWSRLKCPTSILTISCSKGTTTSEQSVDLFNGTAVRRSLALGKRRPSFKCLLPKRQTRRCPKRRPPFSHLWTAGWFWSKWRRLRLATLLARSFWNQRTNVKDFW